MSRRDDDAMNAFDSAPFQVAWTADGHVAEDSIYAWLDGALAASDHDAVAQHVKACTECAKAVAEARGFIAASVRIMNAADLVPRNVVPREDVARTAARIVALADRPHVIAAAGSMVKKRVPAQADSRNWHTLSFFRAVAALLLVAAGSYVGTRPYRTADADVAAGKAGEARNPTATIVSPERKNAPDSAPMAKLPSSVSAVAQIPKPAPAQRPAIAKPSTERKENGPQRLAEVNIQAVASATEQRKLAFTVSTVAALELRTVFSGVVVNQATNQPLAATNVSVAGTPLIVSTDDQGKFTLRDVPLSAEKLQFRRLGFRALEVSLDSLRGLNAMLSVGLSAAPLMLDQVAVASVQLNRPVQDLSCFVVNADLAREQIPLVRRISLRQETAGTFSATIGGWPTPGARTQAVLFMDSARIVRGTVQVPNERLEVELVPAGNVWFSTVRAYRDASIRSENIKYTRDQLAIDCR